MTVTEPAHVLIADDQRDVLLALRLLLQGAGVTVDEASSVAEVLHRVTESDYDLLLMDLNYARDTTSGAEGLGLLADVHMRAPLLPVLVMTGWSTVDLAVAAMRRGARGFVSKPWDNATLVRDIVDEIELARVRRRDNHRISREQDDAKAIQRALLQGDMPDVAGCQVAARWTAAAEFGGDLYDVAALSSGRLAVAIGDVCGKGIPAALLMANVHASARAFATGGMSPSELITSLNRDLVRYAALRRFVTFFYGVYDPTSHRFTYANAGHPPPIVLHRDGSVTRLDAGGTFIGAFADARYDEDSVELASGDRVIMFTDGISEAGSSPDRQFGDEMLVTVLRHHAAAAATRDLVDGLFESALAFCGGQFEDDATILALTIA